MMSWLVLAGAVAVAVVVTVADGATATRPNFVFILADDWVSCVCSQLLGIHMRSVKNSAAECLFLVFNLIKYVKSEFITIFTVGVRLDECGRGRWPAIPTHGQWSAQEITASLHLALCTGSWLYPPHLRSVISKADLQVFFKVGPGAVFNLCNAAAHPSYTGHL